MKLFYFLCICLIIISCASKKQESTLYGKCKFPLYGCSQLLIEKNKTFQYWFFEDVGGETVVKGTWEKINGDTLVLNSYLQPEKDDQLPELNRTFFTNRLVIVKDKKVIFLSRPKFREYTLRKNKMENKMWK